MAPSLLRNHSLATAPGLLLGVMQSEVPDGNGCACAVQLEVAEAERTELEGRGEEAAAQVAQQAADSHGRLAEAAAEAVQARHQASMQLRSVHAKLAASQCYDFDSAYRRQGPWSQLGGCAGVQRIAS